MMPYVAFLLVLPGLVWEDDPPSNPPKGIVATSPSNAASAMDVVAAVETVLGDAIDRVEPSVVAISREKSNNDETLAVRDSEPPRPDANELERQFLVLNPSRLPASDEISLDYGSGVVVGENSEVLTAFHVVRGARRLRVRAADRQEFDAEIIAADPRSDLAVIAPMLRPGEPAPKLKPVTIGDSSKLRKGSFLIALGNPFNAARDGRPSASWGILSNIARRVEPTFDEFHEQRLKLRNYPTLLQLDAKLNLGMSGGAVVNSKGELVGLTTGAANALGFDTQAGYAIPIDQLGRKVIAALKQGKEYEYGFLGIKLDMEQNTNRVGSADHGSPAAEGGVQVDDLIEAVGDIPVHDRDSLVIAINSFPAGETVKFKIRRRNNLIERSVKLAKLKVRDEVIATNRPAPWRGLRIDYSSILAATPLAVQLADAIAKQGVVITEVQNDSEAAKAGLKVNQLITKVNGVRVKDPKEFAQAVSAIKGGAAAEVETESDVVTIK